MSVTGDMVGQSRARDMATDGPEFNLLSSLVVAKICSQPFVALKCRSHSPIIANYGCKTSGAPERALDISIGTIFDTQRPQQPIQTGVGVELG